ncbi:Uma2 family endonuclease [Alsobacter metallidurans]|nr:Uma2 family endonuclease [Alsobacter metallidurans]
MPMNAPVQIPGPIRQTQAAEGLPRRAFSVAEVEQLVEAGILAEDDRLELIGGELVVMPAKGIRHEVVKAALNDLWIRQRPDDLRIVPETTFRLSEDTFLEPDFVVFRKPVTLATIAGPTILLAVEVSDSSLGYDLHRKPAIYARFGVPELWVIDAVRRETHVFTGPGAGGYSHVSVQPASERLVPGLAPDLPLRLDDLDLEWDAADLP